VSPVAVERIRRVKDGRGAGNPFGTRSGQRSRARTRLGARPASR
jgi:hypothetical protein